MTKKIKIKLTKTMKMMAAISASYQTWIETIMKKSSVFGIMMPQTVMRKKMRTIRDCSC